MVLKIHRYQPATTGAMKYISPMKMAKPWNPRNTATGNTVLSSQPQVADVEATVPSRLLMVSSTLPALQQA
ncbi:MAG: hypothetical protein R3C26_13530 [Calditrichia bacterium]